MKNNITIFEEINLNINPYKELKITNESSDETIKEAYKLIRTSISIQDRENIDNAFNMIKTPALRARYNLLRNNPLDSIDEIKKFGLKPVIITTKDWINHIKS